MVLLSVMILLIGCGSKSDFSNDSGTQEMEGSWDTDNAGGMTETNTDSGTIEDMEEKDMDEEYGQDFSNRKIIQSKYLYIETLGFDDTSKDIESLVFKYNGYIESSNIEGISITERSKYNTRYAYYTIRIPAQSFNSFVEEVKGVGNVLQEQVTKEDVTMQYYDLEARIHSLETQEERLLQLLEKGEKLEEVLALEKQLSEVRYQIESYTSTLKGLENKVSYGTVNLELREVIEETQVQEPAKTVGEKISQGFIRSLTSIKNGFINFFIWFVSVIPYLIIWIVFILIIIMIIRTIYKKSQRKFNANLHNTKDQESKKDNNE